MSTQLRSYTLWTFIINFLLLALVACAARPTTPLVIEEPTHLIQTVYLDSTPVAPDPLSIPPLVTDLLIHQSSSRLAAAAAPPLTPLPSPTFVPSWHTIRRGESLASIAKRYGTTTKRLRQLNHSKSLASLEAGELLAIPSSITINLPDCYLIHDSEVVYSPAYIGWRTEKFVTEQGGFLAQYRKGGRSGARIIDDVAAKYHVGPRVLLAVMELMSGWVTEAEPATRYAFGFEKTRQADLEAQATWAAETLMGGYYSKLEGRRDWVELSNGLAIHLSPTINPGSAAVATLLAQVVTPPEAFPTLILGDTFQDTYRRLFGELEGGAIMPPDEEQPTFDLPWQEGEAWVFTGGPHGGYGDHYSGWAALDFAPPTKSGCYPSSFEARAIAPGLVIGSAGGETWVDMDEDGDIRTGWVILYMHLATRGRVAEGTQVERGDVMGHPSCEGGFSTGTHLHLARMYDGQWMPAHGPIPFQLGEWTAQAQIGFSYEGYLSDSSGNLLEACDCRDLEKNVFPVESSLRSE